jgi:hypothetical protein
MLLTSVLAYWLKGLVKRPDEMSATMQMVEDLYLLDRAQNSGLPFLRSRALDHDGLHMSYLLDAQSFKILFHTSVIHPGGLRIKTSKAIRAIPEPDPMQSPPLTPPRAPHDSALWSNESQEFLDQLLGIHLPRALWNRFPDDRKACGLLASRLRDKPLKRNHWHKVVEPLNTLVEVKGKFIESIEKLFPPDWSTGITTGDFATYNKSFLQRIRDHLASKPVATRSAYSTELRRRIRTSLLQHWDYLPSMHAHKMWTFKLGPKGQRIYRVCPSDS